jgi:16S rRNA (guanine966-N2)-methyltransferase
MYGLKPVPFNPICWLAMRIIAGTYRSRTLAAPPGMSTRPTSDRLRETLFNVLAPRIQDAAFLDLYAGSGAVGLEALSRGAASVVFVERAPAALKVLDGNLARLGIGEGVRVHRKSVGAFLKSVAGPNPKPDKIPKPEKNPKQGKSSKPAKYEVVFLDPPYEAAEDYAAQGILTPNAVLIAEHRRKFALDERYGSLKRTRLLEQGDASLSFYAIESDATPA